MTDQPWGIDVSHYQGPINWPTVKKDGCSFAFIKATEQNTTDERFEENWHGARWNGVNLIRGAYHYAHIENNAKEEAIEYVKVVRTAGGFYSGDFAIVDMEDVCNASKSIGPIATGTWVTQFLKTVQSLTRLPNQRIMVYTGKWWWEPRVEPNTIVNNHPLWISGYTATQPSITGWPTKFWQYTDNRKVKGIAKPCDASIFNGTMMQLRKLSQTPLTKVPR